MALQTSGAISLNDMHVEAGGGSGTQASINDADIRGLIGKGSGAQASFSEYYGASAAPAFISQHTITNGLLIDKLTLEGWSADTTLAPGTYYGNNSSGNPNNALGWTSNTWLRFDILATNSALNYRIIVAGSVTANFTSVELHNLSDGRKVTYLSANALITNTTNNTTWIEWPASSPHLLAPEGSQTVVTFY